MTESTNMKKEMTSDRQAGMQVCLQHIKNTADYKISPLLRRIKSGGDSPNLAIRTKGTGSVLI